MGSISCLTLYRKVRYPQNSWICQYWIFRILSQGQRKRVHDRFFECETLAFPDIETATFNDYTVLAPQRNFGYVSEKGTVAIGCDAPFHSVRVCIVHMYHLSASTLASLCNQDRGLEIVQHLSHSSTYSVYYGIIQLSLLSKYQCLVEALEAGDRTEASPSAPSAQRLHLRRLQGDL